MTIDAALIATTRLSDVEPRPVEWLWPGRLPKGKLVVLDGDPGAGKSTLTLDLAARVSTGSPMPDGHRLAEPSSVILLSAEDGPDDTIRPRLDAAGGDPSRVVLLDGCWCPIEEEQADDRHLRPPDLPLDLPVLAQTIRREKAVLVVIDVLNAFLSSKVDGHRDQDIRGALAPLAKVAADTNCCILVLRHLNKGGGSNPLYRGGGSIGIIGAARVGMLAAGDPDDETRRVLAVSKCNVAKIAPALAYRLVDAPEHGCARIVWDGATSHSAADLLAIAPLPGDDEQDATDVLAEVLAAGPRWVADAIARMGEAGFSKDQAKRAKGKLKVRSVKFGKPGDAESGWKWVLRERQGSEGCTVSDLHPSLPSHPSEPPEALSPESLNMSPAGHEGRKGHLLGEVNR